MDAKGQTTEHAESVLNKLPIATLDINLIIEKVF